jgi:serine/threonine protein kinase
VIAAGEKARQNTGLGGRAAKPGKRPFQQALSAGTRLGEYRIRDVLGQGGFAFTYLAQDENLDKPFAIKEYFPVSLAVRDRSGKVVPRSPDHKTELRYGLSRFLRESRVLARFHHPNIVQVLRFFEANDTAYIVMNFLDGEGLHILLNHEQVLDEETLRAVLFPLLDGLERVHDAGILHRDIKPSNIFIEASGSPILLDFGAARDVRRGKSTSLTSFVTHGYAPIEQYGDRSRQGPWTDIYALGAVVYECVTGDVPPDAPERALEDVMVPAVEAAQGRYSEHFLAAIDHALALRPEDRPQTIAQWRGDLTNTRPGRVDAGAPAVDVPHPRPTPVDPRPGGAVRSPTIKRKAGNRPTQVRVGGVTYDIVDPPKSGAAKSGRTSGAARAASAPRDSQEVPAPRRSAPAYTLTLDEPPPVPPANDSNQAAYVRPQPAATQTVTYYAAPRRSPAAGYIHAAALGAAWGGLIAAAIGGFTLQPFVPNTVTARVLDFRAEDGRLAAVARRTAAWMAALKKPPAPVQTAKAPESGNEKLRGLIEGSQIALKRNGSMGRYEGRWTFHRGGKLEGSAFQSRANYEVSLNDRGQWWVKGPNLCIKWNNWDSKAVKCYAITKVAGKTNAYQANGGSGLLTGAFVLER